MNQIHSSLVRFNVGGQAFEFSKETLELPHLEKSVLAIASKGTWDDKEHFIDVDPDLFKKYCAPYIRHKKCPTVHDVLKDRSEAEHLVLAANSIGLLDLAERVDEYIKGTERFIFVVDNGMLKLGKNYVDACPDKACDMNRRGVELLEHLMSKPHFGEIKFFVHDEHEHSSSGVIELFIEKKSK